MQTNQLNPGQDPYLWKQAKERVGFKLHLRAYLIINAGLWLIWAVSAFAVNAYGQERLFFPWPIFPTLGWGIGLVSHYMTVYRRGSQRSMIEAEYQKLLSQRA